MDKEFKLDQRLVIALKPKRSSGIICMSFELVRKIKILVTIQNYVDCVIKTSLKFLVLWGEE